MAVPCLLPQTCCTSMTPGGQAVDPPSRPVLAVELQQEQLEVITHPRSSLSGLAAEIRAGRFYADSLARKAGARIAALATSPVQVTPHATSNDRYDALMEKYAVTAREQLTGGCHVHVSVGSDEEGVAVLDRIRSWLPSLIALSSNSPFWNGTDSGYTSSGPVTDQSGSRGPLPRPPVILATLERVSRGSGSRRPYHQFPAHWAISMVTPASVTIIGGL
jgi:hypothetical protein